MPILGRGRLRSANVWICAATTMCWLGLVIFIWTLQLASDVRLVLVLLVTLICQLPITLRVRVNEGIQAVIRDGSEGAQQSRDRQFLDKLLAGDSSLLHSHPMRFLPNQQVFLAVANGSKNAPAPPPGFGSWTGQYARRAVQKARVLRLLLQFEGGTVVGFGGGKHETCEVEGSYAALDDRTVLVAFSVRFHDHQREFRGLAVNSFALGIRGVWTSKHRRRLGWFRAWPEDSVPPGRTYRMVSNEEDCVVCCRDNAAFPLVALLPCGHILACRECSDGMASCPACRVPMSRVCNPDDILDVDAALSASSVSDAEPETDKDHLVPCSVAVDISEAHDHGSPACHGHITNGYVQQCAP